MFTPIEQLSEPQAAEVLASLDIPAEWESTWDIGLTDMGDSFVVRPLWGRLPVDGRWPAAFALGHRIDPRPWRLSSHEPGGHCAPGRLPVDLESIGIHLSARSGR